MAEFCLDCYNRLNKASLTSKEVALSWFKECCEACGQRKRVVVRFRRRRRLRWVKKD